MDILANDREALLFGHEVAFPCATLQRLVNKCLNAARIQDLDTLVGLIAQMAPVSENLAYTTAGIFNLAQMQGRSRGYDAVDLQWVVEGQQQAFAAELERIGATLTFSLLPTVVADPLSMQVVIRNLVSNAIKYRPYDEALHIEVSDRSTEHEWIIAVSDNGIGIPAQDRSRIFQPGERLNRRLTSGAGYGLTICANIARTHGGRIWAEDNAPRGSTFVFTMPRAVPSQNAVQRRSCTRVIASGCVHFAGIQAGRGRAQLIDEADRGWRIRLRYPLPEGERLYLRRNDREVFAEVRWCRNAMDYTGNAVPNRKDAGLAILEDRLEARRYSPVARRPIFSVN